MNTALTALIAALWLLTLWSAAAAAVLICVPAAALWLIGRIAIVVPWVGVPTAASVLLFVLLGLGWWLGVIAAGVGLAFCVCATARVVAG